MKKILYIATTADNRNRLDGETIKCRLLREYLCNLKDIQVISIDTDNWKKHILKLVFLIIINYFKCDKIVVSSADKGANIVLKYFEKIRCKKDIYYFVTGGKLAKNISNNKWKKSTYQRIKQIYVEADLLKKDLMSLEIENVTVLKNFRKVDKFQNNYKKTKETKFVYYGRVIKEKGIEEAIKLINRLNKENVDCTLHIYGQAKKEYLDYLEKYFSERIVYCGAIKPNNQTEYEILSKYDVFIFPTEYEGECLPGALIDTYIASLATLASNWKYAEEYIKNNENGSLFKYKNYEDMYLKAKELIESGRIMDYKKKSFELSQEYMIENVLLEFGNEISERKTK